MEKTESYSIELNLYNGKNPFELNKFYSISFDTSKINLSTKQTENLVDQFYKEMNIKRKDELMDDLFLTLIHKQFPNFPANTLFVQDIEKINLDLKLSYDYDKIALGDNLIGFLNLDFYKFEDFFKFFCTFIFMYFSKIPKNQLNKIFTGFDENIIYIDSERPTHIVEKSLLKECAKQLYESEKYYLIEKNPATGYQITNEKVFFEIKSNGEIVKAELKNEKIEQPKEETVKVPDTAMDDNEIIVNIILIASGCALLVATGFALYFNDKKKK